MQKRDFETYQKRFRDFEILLKFSDTHVFQGTIHHPYMCIVSVWNTVSEVTMELLEKPCALKPYSCKQSFFFSFFLGYFNQLADYGGNGLTPWVKLWETL